MIIIHAMNDLLPRAAADPLQRALEAMPAVVLSGARQTGKSTLAMGQTGRRRYHTLDDLDTLDLARRDPDALLGGDQPVTLDEVQREPGILSAIKRAIDRHRQPGQFLLTGSANLLLMRRVSESLAGRASHITLWPMTRREQLGLGAAGAWSALLGADEAQWLTTLQDQASARGDWKALAQRGGFPTPAVHMRAAAARATWFDGYLRTYLERDLLDLASVASLPDFRRLMRATALRLGQMLNQTELGRDVGLPQPTVHRWLNLLETGFLLVKLPPYAVNRTKRLVKTPKLYWADTGLALALSEGEPEGPHLENLVVLDLLVWRDATFPRAELSWWRTSTGEEVDLVIEAGGRLLPIEVKATSRPGLGDTAGLRAFRAEYGKRARAGLLVHAGSMEGWLTADVLAVPWWRLL